MMSPTSYQYQPDVPQEDGDSKQVIAGYPFGSVYSSSSGTDNRTFKISHQSPPNTPQRRHPPTYPSGAFAATAPNSWFGVQDTKASEHDFFQSLGSTEQFAVGQNEDDTIDRLSSLSISLSSTAECVAADGNMCPRCRGLLSETKIFCDRCGYQKGEFTSFGANEATDTETRSLLNEQPPRNLFANTAENVYQIAQPNAESTEPTYNTDAAILQPVKSPFVKSKEEVAAIPLMRTTTVESTGASQTGHSVQFRPSYQPITSFAAFSQQGAPGQQQRPFPPRIPLLSKKSVVPVSKGKTAASIPLQVAATEQQVPKPEKRIHPIFCFGFGGQLLTGFPGNAVLYRTTLKNVPRINESCVAPLLKFFDARPITECTGVVEYLQNLLEETFSVSSGRIQLLNYLILMYNNIEGLNSSNETLRNFLLTDATATAQIIKSMAALGDDFLLPPSSPISPDAHSELISLLLTGDFKNALAVLSSTRNFMHALMLAIHIDPEAYGEIVGEIARRSMPLGHFMRTLYLLYAGQHSLLCTIFNLLYFQADRDSFIGSELQHAPELEKMWPAHLLMMMKHPSADNHIAIRGLGDALTEKGLIAAAHLCYLLCDDANLISGLDGEFTRIILLGSDHQRNWATFSHDWQALRFTELLEFALRKASGGSYLMAHLQAYKLLYTCWLADLGLTEHALCYMEYLKNLVSQIDPSEGYIHDLFKTHLAVSYNRLLFHLNGMKQNRKLGETLVPPVPPTTSQKQENIKSDEHLSSIGAQVNEVYSIHIFLFKLIIMMIIGIF